MARYQLDGEGGVIDTVTKASIPPSPTNRDWRAYQEWLRAGNTPDAAPTPPLPPTQDERIEGRVNSDPLFRGLVAELAQQQGISPVEMLDRITAKARGG